MILNSTSTPEELFSYTLKKLEGNLATRGILSRIQDPYYDRKIGLEVCSLIYTLCQKNSTAYDQRITDFIQFCQEFLRLQAELEQTQKYHFSTFAEAQKEIYDNPAVMANRYLYGLLFSQAFWINHNRIFQFFQNPFCSHLSNSGKVLEIPSGTGIFLAKFLQLNPKWYGLGYDISTSAVELSHRVANHMLQNHSLPPIIQQDIFKTTKTESFDCIICGELLDNVEHPDLLLQKLKQLLALEGKIFLTTNAWASTIDHVYLFKSIQEIKQLIQQYFEIELDLPLNLLPNQNPNQEKVPINYACILTHRKSGLY